MLIYTTVDSPVGALTLSGPDGQALSGLYMHEQRHRPPLPAGARRDNAAFADARAQLGEYFAGARTRFELDLRPDGTPFQRAVWAALREIPFGETASYGELARRLGKPGASRAVGLANGRNPIGIVIPCHRVVGSTGSLTGYGGGLERKRFLLEHEAGRLALV